MSADIHTLTGAYALDALSNEEREAFEDHLARCAACRHEVAELRETAARLGSAVAAAPPAQLKADVLERIRRVRQLPPDQGPIIPMRGRKWPLRVAGLAAAASILLALALGIQVFRSAQELESANEQLAQVDGRYTDLVDVVTAPDARVITSTERGMRATVVVSESEGRMAFVPQDMRSPGADKTYQLWLIGPDGARSVGLLASANGPVVTDTIEGTNRFGVTVEPAGGSKQPTTNPVMLVALP
ncbi:MAG: anti-sigma factor [Haloechinothrix sp.]